MSSAIRAGHDDVMAALATVNDPELHASIVRLGMVKALQLEGARVRIEIELTTPACPLKDTIQNDVQLALQPLGIEPDAIDIVWGANVRASTPREGQKSVEGVRNVVAIASNKGGVGKSTVAANLAVALAQAGASVGLVDADITGPNLPTMFGLAQGLQRDSTDGLRIVERHGVHLVSIGFLLPKGTPVVWRGPMIGSAVRQLLHDVPWGDLDYLVIDLPPGTSDASMSLAQEAPVTGAIIVSTPQRVALEDATKAVSMFEKLGVPVFGIVENMSYFVAPDTGKRYEIFGHGGAREAAEDLGLDFLGEIPLELAVGRSGDDGTPVVLSAPESLSSRAFHHLAGTVAARISVLQRMGA